MEGKYGTTGNWTLACTAIPYDPTNPMNLQVHARLESSADDFCYNKKNRERMIVAVGQTEDPCHGRSKPRRTPSSCNGTGCFWMPGWIGFELSLQFMSVGELR